MDVRLLLLADYTVTELTTVPLLLHWPSGCREDRGVPLARFQVQLMNILKIFPLLSLEQLYTIQNVGAVAFYKQPYNTLKMPEERCLSA